MKIVFSKEEVLDIVLEHVLSEFPRTTLNHVEVDGYSSFSSVTVSYEEPVEQELPLQGATDV
jgi:hypothetical protein